MHPDLSFEIARQRHAEQLRAAEWNRSLGDVARSHPTPSAVRRGLGRAFIRMGVMLLGSFTDRDHPIAVQKQEHLAC